MGVMYINTETEDFVTFHENDSPVYRDDALSLFVLLHGSGLKVKLKKINKVSELPEYVLPFLSIIHDEDED